MKWINEDTAAVPLISVKTEVWHYLLIVIPIIPIGPKHMLIVSLGQLRPLISKSWQSHALLILFHALLLIRSPGKFCSNYMKHKYVMKAWWKPHTSSLGWFLCRVSTSLCQHQVHISYSLLILRMACCSSSVWWQVQGSYSPFSW